MTGSRGLNLTGLSDLSGLVRVTTIWLVPHYP